MARLDYSENPVKYRGYIIYHGYGYSGMPLDFVHEDYDGAPDSHDRRLGNGITIQDCIDKIDEQIEWLNS